MMRPFLSAEVTFLRFRRLLVDWVPGDDVDGVFVAFQIAVEGKSRFGLFSVIELEDFKDPQLAAATNPVVHGVP